MLHIQKANKKDALRLTNLTLRSKAYWGYSKEQIEKWRYDLTITTDYITANPTYVLINNSELIGYFSFISESPYNVLLDNLFIEPTEIGKGYGTLLMEAFLKQVNNGVYRKITLEAEPKVEAFYQKFGFKTIALLKSTIKGRFLPFMQKNIHFTI